jgi:hypothetical protein
MERHFVMAASAFVCLAAASPSAAEGPFRLYTLSPCRLVDTRINAQTVGAYGPVLTSDMQRTFPVQGNCGVPAGARAVALNVTATASTGQGRFTLYPSGVATPNASTINFQAGQNLANGAIVPLAAAAPDLAVMPFVVGGGQVHMVIDVTGYFAP